MAIEITEGQRLNKSFFEALLGAVSNSTIEIAELLGEKNLLNNDSGKFFICTGEGSVTFPELDGFFCYIHNTSDSIFEIVFDSNSNNIIQLFPNDSIFVQEYLTVEDENTIQHFTYIGSQNLKNFIPVINITSNYTASLQDNNAVLYISSENTETLEIILPDTYEGFNIRILNCSKKETLVSGLEESGDNLRINGNKLFKIKKSSCHFISKGLGNGYVGLISGGGSSKELVKINSADDVPSEIDSGNILLVKTALTITLPLSEDLDFYVKRVFNTGTLTLKGESGTIDGDATLELANYDTAHLYCDGTNYYLL